MQKDYRVPQQLSRRVYVEGIFFSGRITGNCRGREFASELHKCKYTVADLLTRTVNGGNIP
jgi:hypothetical protein